MAYIIPNAGSTGSSNKYVNINQAEPDSVDIEALGNPVNYIRSGGEVTHATNTTVNVAAGVAVIGGKPYTFSASSAITIPDATNYRFDLLVVRLTGASAAVTRITGTNPAGEDSATNPTLPKSASVRNPGEPFDSTRHYNPATDVLLASVFRANQTSLEPGSIVDKRVFDDTPATYTITGVPSVDATKDKVGDIVVDTTNNKPYARLNSTWEELVTASSLRKMVLPIGSIFAWPGASLPPTVGGVTTCLPCNGQTFNSVTYPDLAAVLGSTYGAVVGTTHTLPNLNNDRTIVGATTNFGQAGGANSVSLVEANIPQHKHNVSVANHANLAHSVSVSTAPDHTHSTVAHVHNGAVIYRTPAEHNGFHVVGDADSTHGSGTTADAFHVDVIGVNENHYTNPFGVAEPYEDTEYQGTVRFESAPNTNPEGNHPHTVTISDHAISNHSVTESNFGANPVTAVATQPSHLKMRWFIQAL